MGLSERQQELVSALLDGALAGDELREAEALVSSEPEAARLLEHYRSDLTRLKGLPRVKAEPRHRARLRLAPTQPRWLKAAAIILIVLGVGFWFYTRRPVRRLISLLPAVQSRVGPGEHRLVKKFDGLTGKLVAAADTAFRLRIEGADGHSSQAHLLLSYDFDGDGKFDRVETYELEADASAGWQELNQDATRLVNVEGGQMRDFADGVVQAELRCTHPQNALLADIQEITLPAESP